MKSNTPTPPNPSIQSSSSRRSRLIPTSSSSSTTSKAAATTTAPKEKRRSVLASLKEWVSTSEPSAEAWKKHTRDAHKNAGVSRKDPRATAKLHLPAGRIPEDAIRPSGRGPDPEELVMRRAEEARAAFASSLGPSGLALHRLGSRTSHAGSSHSTESYASTLGTLFDKPE
ncbi:hypothetical protein MCOR27_001677 [Pyricularia oryzae]|uniref:Uncharacterized protein n=2 Tax=Pyricularia TaxID=48558 RepID=A0ABQ8NWS6_PYRGI|nr:hypothetical protein MCOR01_011193 [Pyricularia oryzae]KAI6303271.1 hypothetical protein MCOR33_001534 [Pyricularia grisea]KAH9437733.1 hypothetical protein MCOR02_001383 [Pyricularia oryzae]KAI6253581.1 hypothetical protein MCOR19_009876 [Pyricularia oryzae]KAI6285167.1 hypothetical protein MCOR26_001653 [Pyricularia oryzae]